MKISKKIIPIFMVLAGLFGCQSNQPASVVESGDIELIETLPKVIGGFKYQSSYRYEHKELGYSIRYRYKDLGYADVYVYPVPKQVQTYPHKEIVIGMTQQAVGEIKMLVDRGAYGKYDILSSKAFGDERSLVSKVEGVLLKDNLESYTLLYLTENNNLLIKARITVNDNEANRSSKEWDSFIGGLFGFINQNIEKA